MESSNFPFRGTVSVLNSPKLSYGKRICLLRGAAAVLVFLYVIQSYVTFKCAKIIRIQ